MSDYRLNTYVHAVEYDDKGQRTGREQTFGPGDNLSAKDNEWALAAITNPDVWSDGNAPKTRPAPPAHQDEVAALKARIAELEQQAAGGPAEEPAKADDTDKPATRGRATGKTATQ